MVMQMLLNFSKLVNHESLPRKQKKNLILFIIWARPQTFFFKLRKKLDKNLAESILLFKQATQQADIQLLDCIFQNIFLLLTEAAIKKIVSASSWWLTAGPERLQ